MTRRCVSEAVTLLSFQAEKEKVRGEKSEKRLRVWGYRWG